MFKFFIGIVLCCFWACFLQAQNEITIIDGNALFDDNESFNYSAFVNCKSNDSLTGEVVYTNKKKFTAHDAARNKFKQELFLQINRKDKRVLMQEGEMISLHQTFSTVCYIKGELSYIVVDGNTYFLGELLGTLNEGEKCNSAFLYWEMVGDIEEICSQKKPSNKNDSLLKKNRVVATEKLVAAFYTKQNELQLVTQSPQPLLASSVEDASVIGLETDTIKLFFSDFDTEDDDRINIYWNGVNIAPATILTQTSAGIQIIVSGNVENNYLGAPLDSIFAQKSFNEKDNKEKQKIDTLMIEAVNEGMYPPNTAFVEVVQANQSQTFTFSANKGSKRYLLFRRRRLK